MSHTVGYKTSYGLLYLWIYIYSDKNSIFSVSHVKNPNQVLKHPREIQELFTSEVNAATSYNCHIFRVIPIQTAAQSHYRVRQIFIIHQGGTFYVLEHSSCAIELKL